MEHCESLPEDPAFNTGGVDQFSNANNFVLNQLIVETNTVLKSSFSPRLNPVLCFIIRHLNKIS
jgi:hypothetical protein